MKHIRRATKGSYSKTCITVRKFLQLEVHQFTN